MSRRPALRAKGIDNEAPALTYTGPAEDGSAQVQRNGGKTPQAGGGARRERREAARRQGARQAAEIGEEAPLGDRRRACAWI